MGTKVSVVNSEHRSSHRKRRATTVKFLSSIHSETTRLVFMRIMWDLCRTPRIQQGVDAQLYRPGKKNNNFSYSPHHQGKYATYEALYYNLGTCTTLLTIETKI